MKIALPSRQNMIDDHFGHCEYFSVFTVNDNKEIISLETIVSPAGCGCKSNIASILAMHMRTAAATDQRHKGERAGG
jgi:predicted Fe-Mo cluster-binding NifX family protein